MKLNANNPFYVVGFTVAISAAFTAVVMSVQEATKARIERNEQLRRERALVRAFGLGDVAQMTGAQVSEVVRTRIVGGLRVRDPETGKEFEVYRAYTTPEAARDRSKQGLVGYAFEVAGSGFWAPIDGLMAVTPDLDKAIGIVFLSQSETPGLGGRITEDWFQDQFRGVAVAPPPKGQSWVYIAREKPPKDDPRRSRTVDAITGATQTSIAVAKFLNADIAEFHRAMAAGPAAQKERP